MSLPLTGVRVLDLTNVLAGPFCGYNLARMGAEVIKIENPVGGDLARQLGADPAMSKKRFGLSFVAVNAGKQSVALDLKSLDGKEAFLRLVDQADVVLENFRPQVMARLGLDYATLSRRNPRLIYCAISGFGQEGPWAHRPAYDQIVQGLSGAMSVTGGPDSAPWPESPAPSPSPPRWWSSARPGADASSTSPCWNPPSPPWVGWSPII